MSSALVDDIQVSQSDSQSPSSSSDPSARQIIDQARSSRRVREARPPMLPACLSAVTAGLGLWASYAPLNFSPLAWFAPVPLLLLVRLVTSPHRLFLATYLGGLAFYLPALQWLHYGDPAMYIAWWALAFYLALTFPLVVGISRVAVHRWNLPLTVIAPVVWVGLEYAKAHLMTGFAWYFLGHTQYRWLELIQISDLVGAYGVSFVMLASAAALTELIPVSWATFLGLTLSPSSVASTSATPPAENSQTPRLLCSQRRWPAFAAFLLFSLTLGYGVVRRDHAEFPPGPRVALIQGNFLASLRIPPEDAVTQHTTHMRLTALAVREQPDIMVWPEAMFRWPLTSAPSGLSAEELQQLAPRAPPEFWRDETVRKSVESEAQKTGAAMIYGIEHVDLQTDGKIRQSNSAILVRPDTGVSGRYDKIHLVPFGEYLPLRDLLPGLQAFTPYPADFGLHAGTAGSVFEYKKWRMLPLICFEDTVPHLVRNLMAASASSVKGDVDLLVNLSNDGWFHGSSGLDQHLITAAFRAVECRAPLVRAVNTGISAIIDGDGAIREPEVFIDGDRKGRTSSRDPKTGRWHRQLNAALVSTVPLDPRSSVYLRYGDLFAQACLGLTLFAALSWMVPRSNTPAVTTN